MKQKGREIRCSKAVVAAVRSVAPEEGSVPAGLLHLTRLVAAVV